MLKDYYQDLKLLRYADGSRTTQGGFTQVAIFKGLIQSPVPTSSFAFDKQTNTENSLLFAEYGTDIRAGDLVENTDGQRYSVPANYQPQGITGIKSNHIELKLGKYDGSQG